MSALTFTLKIKPQQRVDCSPLTPDLLAGKSAKDIAATLLQSGKQQLRADAVFDISGKDSSNIEFKNSHDKLDFIGANMRSGSITIHGNVGSYLGLQMKNGTLTLHGDADAYAACGMAGGLLHINGNVGDFVGGALPGDRKGMRGGTVIITGNAGDRAGDQMRRGVLLIEGNAGQYCASRMIAGTIGVMGSVGKYVGFGMRHGTILLFKHTDFHTTIQDCGHHRLPFLNLMFKAFSTLPSKFAHLSQNRVQKFAGDLANDGKGEILMFT
ncbi:MAG TPA: formylmethanofuran dehydrogenase subunit C [Methylophilaceae bacterium]|jgi:formylmethanofuran dehydrogenase subunit C